MMVSGVCFSAFGAGGGRWEAFTLERSFEYIRHVCHLYAWALYKLAHTYNNIRLYIVQR